MPFIRLNAVRGGKTAHRGIKCLKKRRKSACTRTRFMLLSQGKRLTPQTHALMVKRLRRRPLTAESGVRFPMRVPKKAAKAAFFLYLTGVPKKAAKAAFLFTSTGVPKKAAEAAFFLYLNKGTKKGSRSCFFIYLDRGTKKGSRSCFFYLPRQGYQKGSRGCFFIYLDRGTKKGSRGCFFIYLDCEKRAGNVCIRKCRGRYLHKKTPRRYRNAEATCS